MGKKFHTHNLIYAYSRRHLLEQRPHPHRFIQQAGNIRRIVRIKLESCASTCLYVGKKINTHNLFHAVRRRIPSPLLSLPLTPATTLPLLIFSSISQNTFFTKELISPLYSTLTEKVGTFSYVKRHPHRSTPYLPGPRPTRLLNQ